jgi:ABC-type transport system substrate-binding protein
MFVMMMLAALPAAAGPGVGVMADVGVPDGATASLALRPIKAITVHGGVSHNYVSRGFRGGVALAPINTWIRPTLSADYGRYAEGDANPLARMISGDATYHSATLERVGYSYTNAHIGFEMGRTFTFYLRAGVTRVDGAIRNLGEDSDSITFTQDPRATVTTLSARLGFTYYIK